MRIAAGCNPKKNLKNKCVDCRECSTVHSFSVQQHYA